MVGSAEGVADEGMLGVPPAHPFAPQSYARERQGSGYPLQVRALITGLAAFRFNRSREMHVYVQCGNAPPVELSASNKLLKNASIADVS